VSAVGVGFDIACGNAAIKTAHRGDGGGGRVRSVQGL